MKKANKADKKLIKYYTELSKEQFFESCEKYCSEHDEYIFEKTEGNSFRLGIERGGHSGGYWYVASVSGENDSEICGKIEYISLNEDQPSTARDVIEHIFLVILIILLSPIILLALLGMGIYNLISKKPKLKTPEDKLNYLMTEVLGCRESY